MDNPALFPVFALEAQVIEVAGIPQGVEVALQCGLVVNVAGAGKDVGTNRIRRNAAVTVDLDGLDRFCWALAEIASSVTRQTQVSNAVPILAKSGRSLTRLHQGLMPVCPSSLSSGPGHPDSAGAGQLWELRMRLPQRHVVWKVAILYGPALLKQKA